MSLRKLFAIFIAVAVILAPSAAYAAMPAGPSHDAQTMDMGRCGMMPSKGGDHDRTDGKSCCITMCMAVAVAPTAPVVAAEPKHAFSYFAVPQSWRGYLGEIATPPPRTA